VKTALVQVFMMKNHVTYVQELAEATLYVQLVLALVTFMNQLIFLLILNATAATAKALLLKNVLLAMEILLVKTVQDLPYLK